MAFTPYDQAGWAEYTPLSSQDILQPAMIMGERHAKLEDEYGAINDELQKLAFIADTEPDPMVKQRYESYMSSLQSGMQSLQERGVTPQSRRAMMDVRSRYNSEMMPIKMGYETKLKDIDMYNQMRLKDQSWLGVNPANRSVSDYINNGLNPMPLEGVSGEILAKQAADMADQFSQIMNSGDPQGVLQSVFGPQYQEIMSGAIPGSEAYKHISNYIKNAVLESNKDNLNWARGEDGQIDAHIDSQIQAHLDRGLSHTIGKSQLLSEGMWGYNMKEAERLRAAEEEEVDENQQVAPTPIAGHDYNQGKGNAYTYSANILSGDIPTPGIWASSHEKADYAANRIVRAVRDGKEIVEENPGEKAAYDIYKMFTNNDSKAIEEYIKGNNNIAMNNVIIAAAKEYGIKIDSKVEEPTSTDLAYANKGTASSTSPSMTVKNILERTLPGARHVKLLEGLKKTFDVDTPEKEQKLARALKDFGEHQSIMSGTSYFYDDALRTQYQEKAAVQASRDLHSANASIMQIDFDGKSKEVSLKDLDKSVIDKLAKPTGSDVLGVSLHKGKPMYRIVQTIDGVTYNVYIPSIDLEVPFEVSTAVNNTIWKGVTEPTKIPIHNRNLYAVPEYDKEGNRGYNVAIIEILDDIDPETGEKKQVKHSFESLYKQDFRNLEKTYANKSTKTQ